MPFPTPAASRWRRLELDGFAADDAYFSRESQPSLTLNQSDGRSRPLISELSINRVINARRHASPKMCHVSSSNAFYVRVFKRVTTLEPRRVSGSRSDNNRHPGRNFRHRRTFYTTSVPSRIHLGVLFSAWHQRILLVTEQACAVIVWEIRRRGNDRSQKFPAMKCPDVAS